MNVKKIEEKQSTTCSWQDVWKACGLENEDPGELLKLVRKGK